MPVPKKRQSKSRKNTRKFNWKQEASKETNKALSKAKLVLKQLRIPFTENKTEDNEKS